MSRKSEEKAFSYTQRNEINIGARKQTLKANNLPSKPYLANTLSQIPCNLRNNTKTNLYFLRPNPTRKGLETEKTIVMLSKVRDVICIKA